MFFCLCVSYFYSPYPLPVPRRGCALKPASIISPRPYSIAVFLVFVNPPFSRREIKNSFSVLVKKAIFNLLYFSIYFLVGATVGEREKKTVRVFFKLGTAE
jgi:hypothetical protein